MNTCIRFSNTYRDWHITVLCGPKQIDVGCIFDMRVVFPAWIQAPVSLLRRNIPQSGHVIAKCRLSFSVMIFSTCGQKNNTLGNIFVPTSLQNVRLNGSVI